MENITVIIPIHKLNKSELELLEKSIKSVFSQTEKVEHLIIVGPNGVDGYLPINKEIAERKTFIVNDGETDYCSQINLAVKSVKTKYFSILEFDDTYKPHWFKNVKKYIQTTPEVSAFLPIIQYVDQENNDICLGNEITWTSSFMGEGGLGWIDQDTLQSYYDFSPSGGVFRTEDFIEVGSLKPSIKLSFWYEFMLRFTNSDYKIFVIPKTGYVHMVNRDGSLTNEMTNMSEKEKLFWVDLAKKEYYFKSERLEKSVFTEKKKIEDIL